MAGWTGTEIDSPSGARLNAFMLTPANDAKAVVQINHGLAEHAARYERFAVYLADRGYASVAHDHRGHGATTAPDAQFGHFGDNDGLGKVLTDIRAVNVAIAEKYPGVPIVCFGHSLGGILAMNHALRHPDTISALAVWNTNIQSSPLLSLVAWLLKAERMFKGSDVPSSFATRLTFDAWNREFAPNRTRFDWLSRDETEVDKYIADPLCGFDASVGAWLDILRAIRHGAKAGNRDDLPGDLPVNLVAGAADPSSEHGTAMARFGKQLRDRGMRNVTIAIYPDARHESLNETNRDEIMRDFADWLDASVQ